ncbi:amino acid adenylation domain-containing protein [Pseudomonas yamanorum]|nr:amino acid adenylation domain-containing protein [Pseudomonas yamanorum]
MQFSELLAVLSTYPIRLQLEEGDLIILGDDDALDDALWDQLIAHKPQLLELVAQHGGDWLSPAYRITPDMLPLVTLDQLAIDRIVATVPGGAANVQDIYPLAPLQEGMLYHHVSSREGDPYVLHAQFVFDNRARLEAFSEALQWVIDRHDILRTSMVWERLDEPLQVVWRQARLVCEEALFSATDGDALTQLRARYDARDYRMDLGQAPLLRLVFTEDPLHQRMVAMLLFHHTILDHTALDVVRREIQLYLAGQTELAGTPVPFRGYIAQVRQGVSEQAHEAFFREMLADVDEPTLPFGLNEVQGDGHGIDEARITVEHDLSQRLRAQARPLGVSPVSMMHLAMARVLGQVSGRESVVFGTVMLGRMGAGEGSDQALGMFINTLPLRVDVGEQGVRAAVKVTHERLTALLNHEHASLALAQRCSAVAAPTPLFSAILNYRHSDAADTADVIEIAEGIQVLGAEERTNYPLTVNVDDLGEDFALTVLVDTAIGATRIAGYLHKALESLVQALEQSPDAALHSLDILPAAERQHLLFGLNDTAIDYDLNQTIHGLFEQQVLRTPSAVALQAGDQQLTYAELDQRANQLAHHLRELGVQPDTRVAICVERGLDMMIGLLAIHKSGGGYVPLDPAYPLERIAYMLQDSAPVAVLVQTATRPLLGAVTVPVVDLDCCTWQQQPTGKPSVPEHTAHHLAYVIYTSGSTGQPKGVSNEHGAVVNRLLWGQGAYGLTAGDIVLQKTPFSFDVSVWELFWPLITGAKLVMARPGGHKDPAYLREVIAAARITTMHFVPSMLDVFLAFGDISQSNGLVRVMCSGEALPGSLVRRFKQQLPGCELHNLYGPTEAAVEVTAWDCAGPVEQVADNTPIGKPIANTRMYLLDAQLQPVPLGVIGELFIGGVQVARGYLNRIQATLEGDVTQACGVDTQQQVTQGHDAEHLGKAEGHPQLAAGEHGRGKKGESQQHHGR